jgi:hypothetical protein
MLTDNMFSLQFFVYKTPGIDGDNNFPLFYFRTKAEAHDFIRRLVSVPRDAESNSEYMVLNNPQHLPDDVRRPHMYTSDDPNHADFGEMDGHYKIHDNYALLYSAYIENNTKSDFGFRDYLIDLQNRQ